MKMETDWKEITASKVFGIALIATGIYVAVKYHKRDGFWDGVLAMGLITGVLSMKVYTK